MLTIEKMLNGDCTTLKLIGRLDTTTSPELDAVIDACVENTKELVLDCGALAYISSAGLRVILKAQKQMSKLGGMKLVCVNDAIMEVLDITGFTDILTIE